MSQTESVRSNDAHYRDSLHDLISKSGGVVEHHNTGVSPSTRKDPLSTEISVDGGKLTITEFSEKKGGNTDSFMTVICKLEKNGQTIEVTEHGGTLGKVKLNGQAVDPNGKFAEQFGDLMAYMNQVVQAEYQKIRREKQSQVTNAEEETRSAFEDLLK